MSGGVLKMVNMHEAKTTLAALVASDEPFILAKAGKPRAVVVPYEQYQAEQKRAVKRLGFLPGLVVPDDFDTAMQDEIEEMFYGGDTP
jgi:prevent-host-death family protein